MKIGNMRHVIYLQRPNETVNDGGTATTTWQPFATLRAERLVADFSETVADGGAEDRETVRFRTRFLAKITLDMRVQFGGQNYNIKRLQQSGNSRFMEIEAVKVGG